MSIPATLQQAMTEIGPLLEVEEVTEYPDQKLWIISIDLDTILFAEYDEASRQLILSADVTEVPSERRTELFDLLLRYNGRWEDTGGLCMSLDKDGQVIQQSAALPAEDLDTQALHTVLMNFLDVLGNWREQILHKSPARTGADLDSSSDTESDIEHSSLPPPEFGMRI
jgi:hypothetical protein